ncbi:hypothetical protein ABW20_dc0106574 [Dactylellina cionopaga]|nr:hypothetical protein ABW20_dc0106574 [Dactylellina cionopaga]
MSIDGTIIEIPIELLFRVTNDRDDSCVLAVRSILDYPTNTTADHILGFPFIRSAYTVFDRTHGQTHIAPRRLTVPSVSSNLTLVGLNNDTVSGTGAPLTATIIPATSTLSRPLEQTGPSVTPATSTTITSLASPTSNGGGQKFYHAPGSTPNIGAIVGGVIGGIVFLAMVIVFYPLLKAYKARKQRQKSRAREQSRTSSGSARGLRPANSDSNDGDDKDSDGITTVIVMEENKKAAIAGPAAKRENLRGNKSVVNITRR